MVFLGLAFKSLISRRGSVVLTCLAMTVSIFVILGVEHIRTQAKESFYNTVSGADLIVGARTGSANLLLYSVFRIGSATNNVSWESYSDITADDRVKWAIPISLGDSHKGYRVMGTTLSYFEHYSYGKKRNLKFANGKPFHDLFDVVLGSQVAKNLGYGIGDQITLAHGIGKTSFSMHDDKPFRISGILAPTGTPVDQTLHVSLQGIEAIHLDWQPGSRKSGPEVNSLVKEDLAIKSITAFILGLKSRMTTFEVQREINEFSKEPLLAILPGVALAELWEMVNILEGVLQLISYLILFSALLGLAAMLLASMREREQEIKLFRAIGASPSFLFVLIQVEALIICGSSILIGSACLLLGLGVTKEKLSANFGLYVEANIFSTNSVLLLSLVVIATVAVASIPSLGAYKQARSVT